MEVNKADIKLVIGLGNPGEEYENTCHNSGALFVGYLAKNSGLKWQTAKNFQYAKFGGKIIARANVFMNESGKAVAEATKYFSSKGGKIKPDQILIAHDDSDIELGKYKLQFNRSSAGHKGVGSIIKALKTQKFWRLRIGIGTLKTGLLAKLRGRKKAGDLVLKKISNEDRKKLNDVFEKTSKEVFTKP